MAVLEQQKKALGKTVRRLQAAESVRVDLDAVSYTHLDVYKRQTWTRSGRRKH